MEHISDEMWGAGQKRKFVAESMTAEQARIKALSCAKIKTETELIPLFNKIDEACRNGLFETDFIGDLSEQALTRLKELGYTYYKIGPSHPMDEEFAPNGIRISWRKSEK